MRAAGRPVARGALEGALVGGLYGLTEVALAWHLPALWGDAAGFTRGHLAYELLLAAFYPLAGFLLGGVAAVAAQPLLGRRASWPHHGAPRALAVLPLALFCGLVLIPTRTRSLAEPLAAVAAALVLACLLSLGSSRLARALAFVVNAPAAVALLVLPAWITSALLGVSDGWRARALPLGLALLLAGAAFLVRALHLSSQRAAAPRPDWLLRRGLGVVLAGWMLIAVVSLMRLERAPDLLGLVTPRPDAPRGPNVVMVVLDTVRADHLSLYGYERATTPRLDALAGEALVFEDAVAPGDMTLSSHASLFTGLYARSHGAHFDERGVGRPLAPGFVTLAETLADAGWLTLGVAANHVFFGRGYGLEQGFAGLGARAPDEYLLLHEAGMLPWYSLGRALHRRLARGADRRVELRHYRPAEDVMAQGLELVDAAAQARRPLFLFINLMDAHWPFVPPPPFDQRFPGRDVRFEDPAWRYEVVGAVVKRREREVTPAERAHMESQYDGAIAYMDRQVGALVDRLRERGLWDDTLLVVTSDHGEAFGEHQLVGHALSVYQDQVHVPLVIKLPEGPGGRVAGPVSLVDVAPTVLEALGLEPPAGVHGRALSAVAPTDARPPVVAESFPNPSLGGARLDRVARALREGRLKLIRSGASADELFDLALDPRELDDLSGEEPRAAHLSRRLDDWLEAVPEAAAGAALDDEATLERLRALGYAR